MNIKSYTLTKLYKAREIVGIVNACDLIIAMRLHSMIYALENVDMAMALINRADEFEKSGDIS